MKQCGDTEADGEYWVYPSNLQGKRMKVHCYEMKTDTPSEYITLPQYNGGEYPDACNLNCNGETDYNCPAEDRVGEVTYWKIGIHLDVSKPVVI